MGWLVGWRTKEDLVKHLLDQEGGSCDVLDHSLVGNNLWMVLRNKRDSDTDGGRFILLAKLGYVRDSGPPGRDWGYKDVSEAMGPCELDCPERLLAQSDDQSKYAVPWRQSCRDARAAKTGSAQFIAGLKRGDQFSFNGATVTFTRTITRMRGGKKFVYILGTVGDDDTEYRWAKTRIRQMPTPTPAPEPEPELTAEPAGEQFALLAA